MTIDATIPRWPTATLVPQQPGVGQSRPVISGPQPLSGRPQVVTAPSGAWRVSLPGIRVHGHSRVRDMRAILFGRLTQGQPVYMPFWDWRRAPRQRAGLSIYNGTPPSGVLGATYVQSAGDATLDVSAAAQANTLTILCAAPIVLRPGDYFGIDERVHLVRSAVADAGNAQRFTVGIWPPLRKAATSGTLIELSDPCLRMVLDPKDMEPLLTLDLDRVGHVSLNFYEANWT